MAIKYPVLHPEGTAAGNVVVRPAHVSVRVGAAVRGPDGDRVLGPRAVLQQLRARPEHRLVHREVGPALADKERLASPCGDGRLLLGREGVVLEVERIAGHRVLVHEAWLAVRAAHRRHDRPSTAGGGHITVDLECAAAVPLGKDGVHAAGLAASRQVISTTRRALHLLLWTDGRVHLKHAALRAAASVGRRPITEGPVYVITGIAVPARVTVVVDVVADTT
mmetsp:Transcript_15268/g.38775  ORF Transcript_15268/g.38775 Transcript_15268/m.38775 type:complete len:222 (-) Transcript_15268:41-706(-)